MQKFTELKYILPDYEKEKASLLKSKKNMAAASPVQVAVNLISRRY